MKLTRSQFIKIATILPIALKEQNIYTGSDADNGNMIFGWTTCLTYQTDDRKPGYDYYSNLLDEMKKHGMSRLIVMMASHGYFSPPNHGLAWPAKNKKLKPQIDKNAVNGKEETEFFSKVIKKDIPSVLKLLLK